ncbi:MCE family protein [Mycobacterium sp.]|uniref:MCE family protein n=1 Tax=Mycobacterium sp. TaxID=1785 RepID=UPI003A865909
MAGTSKWRQLKARRKRPLETYNTTWLGFIACAVVAVLIGAMLSVHALGVGYRRYTAEFLQAAALRPGNPITVAGIPVGEVTSMTLRGDHVEAGLKVRNDVVLGRDSRASVEVTTILGSRYLAIEPNGTGSLPKATFDLAHTEVPYDLQSALHDATTTFEQIDSDRFAHSLSVLGNQLRGLPAVVPQAMANLDALSSIISQRRDQIGTLLENTEKVTNTLRRQQSNIGTVVNQAQDLLGEFVARRAVFHSTMQSLTSLVDTMNQVVVGDRTGIEGLIADLREFTAMLAQHDDLLRSMLQSAPVFIREVANATGDGNAVAINVPNSLLIDSWMCAISADAQRRGMIPYFKDCK